MADAAPAFASLSATMIRRAPPPETLVAVAPEIAPPVSGGWREDAKLFAFTWAAGFVFFLVFLA